VDERGVAEAQVYGCGAAHSSQCPVQGLHSVLSSRLRSRLQVWLIQLNDVRTRGEEISHLRVDGVGESIGKLLRIAVIVVLGLLGHGERARHCDLDGAIGVSAQEAHVRGVYRVRPPHRTDHPGYGIGMAAAVARLARVVEVESQQCGREVVRVALPPDLAVGQDVEPRVLLCPDRQQGRVILRLRQVLRFGSPKLTSAYPRREPVSELRAVDQPIRLGEASHEAGREQR
jgi:hypothetical protein